MFYGFICIFWLCLIVRYLNSYNYINRLPKINVNDKLDGWEFLGYYLDANPHVGPPAGFWEKMEGLLTYPATGSNMPNTIINKLLENIMEKNYIKSAGVLKNLHKYHAGVDANVQKLDNLALLTREKVHLEKETIEYYIDTLTINLAEKTLKQNPVLYSSILSASALARNESLTVPQLQRLEKEFNTMRRNFNGKGLAWLDAENESFLQRKILEHKKQARLLTGATKDTYVQLAKINPDSWPEDILNLVKNIKNQ